MERLRFAPIPAGLPATVPFTGPETLERRQGHRFRARLGANENGFGPSPRAVEAMRAAVAETWKYGDPDSHDLRAALAAHHGVAPAQIMPGEGIDGLLGLAVRLFLAPGEAVVTSDGAYPTFNYHVAGFGGVLHKVPFRDDAEDPDALVARAAESGARLVYLANPDNPMGSWQAPGRIEAMLDHLPPGALLLLDEAYADFLSDEALPRIDVEDPRVIRFRTFSKAHGMAGARIGYALGPAAAMATSPARCWTGSPGPGCSCGCRARRRSTAASASAAAPKPTSTPSPRRCPAPSPRRGTARSPAARRG